MEIKFLITVIPGFNIEIFLQYISVMYSRTVVTTTAKATLTYTGTVPGLINASIPKIKTAPNP